MLYFIPALIAVNVALGIANGWLAWRHYRAIRKWYALDQLLTQMAYQSLVNHTLPLWSAWGQVMGSMDIEVKIHRQLPKAD